MLQLTDEQEEFIEKHQIPSELIFDASGLKKKEYKIVMKENKTYYAIGAGDCSRIGHTDSPPIKDKYGHCIMCPNGWFSLKTCKGGYENVEAYVYIAISQIEKIVKVGFSKNIQNRKTKQPLKQAQARKIQTEEKDSKISLFSWFLIIVVFVILVMLFVKSVF